MAIATSMRYYRVYSPLDASVGTLIVEAANDTGMYVYGWRASERRFVDDFDLYGRYLLEPMDMSVHELDRAEAEALASSLGADLRDLDILVPSA